MTDIRIMSFNVRIQTEGDREQQFFYRAGFIAETLPGLHADVIGLQELAPVMRAELVRRLPGYVFLGGGRDADRLGESACIAVRQDRFLIERVFTEILSPTPTVPGSTYGGDQSVCPRVLTTCDLMPVTGGRPFRIMNIHTDHIGREARRLEIRQMLSVYREQQALRPMPTVITGDFNAMPHDAEMSEIMNDPEWKDFTSGIGGTFHGYGSVPPVKIDYIFGTDGWKVAAVFSPHLKKESLFLSDHDPVVADLTLSDL